MKIKDIIKESRWVQRPTNYIQLAKNLVESYPYGLSHGVQKDAIQNGWDARAKYAKNWLEKNWRFRFELKEIPEKKIKVLMMIDYGTFGLTGKLTAADVKDEYEELEEDERWARWESFAFEKEAGGSLGARGQGKMIFFGGSKDYQIIYDSLRKDGTYRFGLSYATKKGCPVVHFDGKEAKEKIKELGLDPINHTGSRIIIINPRDELIESIKKGDFLSYIEETWWPIILKYNVNITVEPDGKIYNAKVPKLFPIKKEMESDHFRIWVKPPATINYRGEKYRIKTLCFACNLKEKIPEFNWGVSCFRSGMKVETIKFPLRKYRENIYGYVEFDKDLDEELRELEYPNHYGFRGYGLWRKIKDYIEEELEAFGNKKLGLGIDRRAEASARRNTAENRALSVMRKITKNWALLVGSLGGGGGNGNGDSSLKEIGVRLSGLKFPNEGNIPRVDYDDSIRDFVPVIFNKTDNSIKLLFTMYVLSGDRKIIDLERKIVSVDPHFQKNLSGGYEIEIDKKLFQEPGEYKLRLAITDASKKKLDEVTRRFWVEMDPKLKAPFEIKKRDFAEVSSDLAELEWFLEPKGDNKYTLFYNWGHSAYLHNDENEEKLSRYLSEIFCKGALQLLIKQVKDMDEDAKKKENLPFDLDTLFSNNPVEVYKEISKTISSIRFQIHHLI